jgi:phosphoserine phosphatase RsbU/P
VAEASLTDMKPSVQPEELLALLLQIGAELSRTLEVKELFPKIGDSLFQVFPLADRAFIILAEEAPEIKLIPKVIKTRQAGEESMARFSRKIVNRCLETAQALLCEETTADQRSDLSPSISDSKLRSVMCAPLTMKTSGKAFGVIQLDSQDRFKKFTQDDLRLLLSVAGQAAIALENARNHEMSSANARPERTIN